MITNRGDKRVGWIVFRQIISAKFDQKLLLGHGLGRLIRSGTDRTLLTFLSLGSSWVRFRVHINSNYLEFWVIRVRVDRVLDHLILSSLRFRVISDQIKLFL
jgi:hypothetical protein